MYAVLGVIEVQNIVQNHLKKVENVVSALRRTSAVHVRSRGAGAFSMRFGCVFYKVFYEYSILMYSDVFRCILREYCILVYSDVF